MKKLISCLTVMFVFTMAVYSAQAQYVQDWNDDDGGWIYYDGGEPPVDWHASGGIGDSGHVSTPLGDLDLWEVYWPLYRNFTDVFSGPDLLENQSISIWVRDMDNVDLQGGDMVFQMRTRAGAWIYYNTPFDLSGLSDEWSQTAIQITSDLDDWTYVTGGDGMPTDEAVFGDPRQLGFFIVDGGAPSGQLGFDNLAIIPEPSTLALLGLAGLLLMKRRRV